MIEKSLATMAMIAIIFAAASRMEARTPADLGPQPEAKDSCSGPRPDLAPGRPAPPVLRVIVDPGLNLDDNTDVFYQEAAGLLDGSPFVPDDRARFYSAYMNNETETIHGWSAWVEEVEAIGDGYLVTISVSPSMSSTRWGAVAIVCVSYFEQYRVTDGRVTYAGFLDPDGASGREFGVIGL